MASPSSKRIHLSEHTKRLLATLTDQRKMDFTAALELLATDPLPDGHSKISLDGFPYRPGTCVYANHGFILTYRVQDDESIHIAALRER